MTKNILILVLMAGLAYCGVSHLRERMVVPGGAFGVVMENNGVVATDAVEPGPIWLWHGQTLLLYRSTPMDVTIPVRALSDVYDGRTVPALGITYSYAARTAQAFVGQRRNGLRRDERGLILAGFHEVVAAMRSALTGGALKLQERPGRDDIEGVRQFLTLIAEGGAVAVVRAFRRDVAGAWCVACCAGFRADRGCVRGCLRVVLRC